jgi:hypothetical protein
MKKIYKKFKFFTLLSYLRVIMAIKLFSLHLTFSFPTLNENYSFYHHENFSSEGSDKKLISLISATDKIPSHIITEKLATAMQKIIITALIKVNKPEIMGIN